MYKYGRIYLYGYMDIYVYIPSVLIEDAMKAAMLTVSNCMVRTMYVYDYIFMYT
jgi:hypothetical protein